MLLIVTFLAVISNIYLGLIAYLKNPKSATGRMFIILTLILSLWAVTNYFSLNFQDPEEILFWIRAVMVVTAAMFPAIYLLTTAFPTNSLNLSKWKIVAIILFIFLTQILATTSLVFQKVEITNGSVNPVPGPAIPIFALNFLGFLILTLITLYKKNKQLTGLAKLQFKYLLLGIALTFVLGVTTNFIFVVLFKNTFFVSLGPLFSLILVGFVAYAIIRHRFFDIRLVVARSVSYLLLVITGGAFYAGGLFLVGTYIVKQPSSSISLITSTVLALIIAFTFQTFLRFFQKITDRIFFKDHYDPQIVLSRLGHLMAATLDLSELANELLKDLSSTLKIIRGHIVLINGSTDMWVRSVGENHRGSFDNEKIKKLINYASQQMNDDREHLLIFEEMEESEIKEIMRNYNFNVILPLTVGDKPIGAIILGEKSSGDVYSGEDIDLLKIIGPEAAVAIKNSLSYEEIKSFNITLRDEVGKATKDLKIANEKLKELDKLKDDFVSIASHELRTPMTAVKSYLWMALKRGDIKLTEKMEKYLSRAYLSTERLINLVNDMLNVSRIESGRIEIKPQTFDLQNLVEEVISMVTPKASEKNIHLNISQTTIPKVFADPDKVNQILLNILGNALKFTPQEGNIDVSFFCDGKVVETSVKDSGVGIGKDDLSRLFQKFGRLDNSYVAAATSGGTGLGLYISRSLVEFMKGKIWATSEGEGKGSVFTFSLPVASPEVVSQSETYTKRVIGGAKTLEPVAI